MVCFFAYKDKVCCKRKGIALALNDRNQFHVHIMVLGFVTPYISYTLATQTQSPRIRPTLFIKRIHKWKLQRISNRKRESKKGRSFSHVLPTYFNPLQTYGKLTELHRETCPNIIVSRKNLTQ